MAPTILVTGGHGFLGSRVVRCLADRLPNSRLIVVGRSEPPRRRDHLQIADVRGDLRDARVWGALPTSITHVVHMAAVIPRTLAARQQAGLLADNVLPVDHLVEHSQRWPGLQQVIYSSSVSVYAPTTALLDEDSPTGPTDAYGAGKLEGEARLGALAARGVRTVAVRLSSLYGHGQHAGTVLPIMVARARQGQEIVIFGDGTRPQDFLHCEDAADAIWLCVRHNAHGVYNLGTGMPVTLTDLAQTVSRVWTQGSTPIVYRAAADGADLGIRLDISRARRDLHYEPQFPLRRGLEHLLQEMGEAGE